MLRALLGDRFNLRLHSEMRDLPVVALLVGKSGAKNLRPTDSTGPPELKAADGEVTAKHVGMALFAKALGGSPPYGIQEPVVDQTGLAGTFDLALDVRSFDTGNPVFAGDWEEMRSALFLFLSEKLEKQYGLKLEHRKIALESIVVDSASKSPTPN
jgi:uncharacterized protein (TIGR03435 family)